MLPNLIVIGAAKCGTTSLHRYLDLHPEIAMSRIKELNFFSSEHDAAGRRWYEAQFPPGTAIRGESSPAYTTLPEYGDVPGRIAALVPGAKLIYAVRDPVDRIVSMYRYDRFAVHDPTDELDDLPGNLERTQTVFTSRYAYQLELYLERFPSERILVVDHAALLHDRVATMQRVFRFLGVDDTFSSPAFEVQHNASAGNLHANRTGRAALRALDRIAGRRRALAIRARIPQALARPLLHDPAAPQVELDPALREELEDFLRPDAARFRELTGMAFESWCV